MRLPNLCPSLVVSANFPHVIAAGPLSKQPSSMPYRVALIQYEDGTFTVHNEIFEALPSSAVEFPNEEPLVDYTRSNLSSGDYFKASELVEATKCFAERVARRAGELNSLYRAVPKSLRSCNDTRFPSRSKFTYKWAAEKLGNRPKRKLENNTYLERVDEHTLAVRLHSTNIVLLHDNGTYTLDSGGWRTVTTRDRMNRYCPARVYQENNIWYVTTGSGRVVYDDGMIVGPKGGVRQGGLECAKVEKDKRKPDRLTRKYIKGFMDSVKGVGLTPPSQGDCWGCLWEAQNPDPNDQFKGLEVTGLDHYFGYFEENYYVPALLMKACVEQGSNPSFLWQMIDCDVKRGSMDLLDRTLTSFFRRRKPGLLKLM